jgi:tRNA G18 (ribose-2'-O)-methylase SpoU
VPSLPVDDPDDPRIVEFIGLRDNELRRRRESGDGDMAGVFIAEGDVVVERAARSGYRCRAAIVDATRTQPLPAALGDVPLFAAGPTVLRRITGMSVHRGVLASFDRRPLPAASDLLAAARRVVVLENVVNPTNVGVIARSALAFGIEALLLDPTSCDPLYRRASRVSMGEVFALPHARLAHLPDGLDVLVAHGFTPVALTPALDAQPLRAFVSGHAGTARVALVLGTEGHGLPATTMERCCRVRIPIDHRVDSLNVGAAAAIAMYELSMLT